MLSSVAKVILHTVDGGGDKVAFVPLGRNGSKGFAVVDEADLKMLQELGLSLSWNRNPTTGVVVAPAARASGSRVLVSRVILDCGPGQNVRYLDGDPTNLRRSNLEVNPNGYAIRRDRDFITPKGKSQQWGIIEHVYRTIKVED